VDGDVSAINKNFWWRIVAIAPRLSLGSVGFGVLSQPTWNTATAATQDNEILQENEKQW
jgi:hypothetical protein